MKSNPFVDAVVREPEELPVPGDAPEEEAPDSPSDDTSEGEGTEDTDTSEGEGTEDTDTSEGEGTEITETTELVGVPEPTGEEPLPFDTLTWSLLGISIALAIAVVIQAVLLLMGRKKRAGKEAAPVTPVGDISIGKLHCQGARESQQDCFGLTPPELGDSHGLLAVVADGMGGLANGDRVSQAAVAAMLDGFFNTTGTPDDILLELARLANQQVNQLLGPGGIGKSGSTLVAGLVREGYFHYICIGDSRICLLREGRLIQLNREHIYRHELSIQAMNGVGTLRGAATHSNGGGLTSYLGMGTLKYVDIPAQPVSVCGGDKFILMSDGVYNALTEAELIQGLEGTAQEAADCIEAMIAKKACLNQDNYTAIILSF